MKNVFKVIVFLLVILSILSPSIYADNVDNAEIIGIPDIHRPDPLLIESPTDFWLSSLIWQPLTWYENGQIYPVIAESWTSSGTLWTFKIKKHLVWQNGTPITATDVVETYNYLLHMPINHRRGATIWLLISNIRSVETASNNTVVFHLFKPDSNFARDVTSNIFILPKYLRTLDITINHAFWGSGMYYIVNTSSGSILLKHNPMYKGYIPYPETLIFTSTIAQTSNYITYPSINGTQQYNVAIRLVFNTQKEPFTTWPYRYLLIATLPYEKLSTTGTAGTPCLIKSPLCHSSLHIDRLVFNVNEFIDNYSIDINRLKNLTLAVPPHLTDTAKQITEKWNKIGIHVDIKIVSTYTLMHSPPNVNMILIPVGGSTSPYTLASPDFPFSHWNYPNFFIKLSEGITGDHTKLVTALEILDYTYPSTTILFPKIYTHISKSYFRKHIAGLGIPMLTSPIDDPTILITSTTETQKTASTSTTTSTTNKWMTFLKIGLIAVIGISSVLLLLIFLIPRIKLLWKKTTHFPTLLIFGNIGMLLTKLKKTVLFKYKLSQISAKNKDTAETEGKTQEEEQQQSAEKKEIREIETTQHVRKLFIAKTIKLRNFMNNIKSVLSSTLGKLAEIGKHVHEVISEKLKILKEKTRKPKVHPTDEMLKKTTETIISHIEKVGMHGEEIIPEDTIPASLSEPNREANTQAKETLENNDLIPALSDEDIEKPALKDLKEKEEKPEEISSQGTETQDNETTLSEAITESSPKTISTLSQDETIITPSEEHKEKTQKDEETSIKEEIPQQEDFSDTTIPQGEMENLNPQETDEKEKTSTKLKDIDNTSHESEPTYPTTLSQEEIEKLFEQKTKAISDEETPHDEIHQTNESSQEAEAQEGNQESTSNTLSQEDIEKILTEQQVKEDKPESPKTDWNSESQKAKQQETSENNTTQETHKASSLSQEEIEKLFAQQTGEYEEVPITTEDVSSEAVNQQNAPQDTLTQSNLSHEDIENHTTQQEKASEMVDKTAAILAQEDTPKTTLSQEEIEKLITEQENKEEKEKLEENNDKEDG